MDNWLLSSPATLIQVAIITVVVYFVIIALVRIGGLRTLASMSSYDFAVTVSLGTVLASTIMNTSQSLVQGIMVMGLLVGLQVVFSFLKRKFDWFGKTVNNTPLLIMDGPTILWDNMKTARLDENELYQKLRENNVLRFDEIKAVVLETTGTISVLKSGNPNDTVDAELLKHVRREG